MKKYFFLVVSISIIYLIGCSPKSYYYDYESMKDMVEMIEIIDVGEQHIEAGYLGNSYILLKTLSGDEKNELLSELSKIEFVVSTPPSTSLKGICLKLYYVDENYGFISRDKSATMTNHEDSNKGGLIKGMPQGLSCSEQDFNNLISKFIE